MNSIVQLAAVVGISALGAGGTFLVKGAPNRILVCDPATLKPDEICLDQVVEPVLWIDARLRREWQTNGLTGSLLWNTDPKENVSEFEATVAEKLLETPNVVVYCGDESCGISRQVANQIRALGIANEVKALRGGWRALNEAGRIKGSN